MKNIKIDICIMNTLPPNLAASRVSLLPLENHFSQRFLEILARGAIRYCVRNKIEIPSTYDAFLRNIVNVAKSEGQNGTFLIQDKREIDAIYELFGLNMRDSSSPDYISQLMKLATVKSPKTSPVDKRQALQSFGGNFYELAQAFGSGVCHNRLAFEKMQELLSNGELGLILKEEGINLKEKMDVVDPELLRLASISEKYITSS